jgi:hypothetical protein
MNSIFFSRSALRTSITERFLKRQKKLEKQKRSVKFRFLHSINLDLILYSNDKSRRIGEYSQIFRNDESARYKIYGIL